MDSKLIIYFFKNKYSLLYILIPLLLLHLLNCFLEDKHNKKNFNKQNEKTTKNEYIESFCIVSTIILLMFFIMNIPIIKNIILIINSSFLIYLLIIVPIFNKKIDYNFIEEKTMVSSFLLIQLSTFLLNIKIESSTLISNNIILQILILFIIIFLITYIFLINFRSILYYLGINTFEFMYKKLDILINRLTKKYYKISNNCSLKCNNTMLKYFFDIAKKILFFSFFIFIIRSLLIVIIFFIKIIKNRFNIIDNSWIYIISKIAIIFTIFFLYLALQTSNNIEPKIISSYEFISSAIVIPLILESLLKIHHKN